MGRHSGLCHTVSVPELEAAGLVQPRGEREREREEGRKSRLRSSPPPCLPAHPLPLHAFKACTRSGPTERYRDREEANDQRIERSTPASFVACPGLEDSLAEREWRQETATERGAGDWSGGEGAGRRERRERNQQAKGMGREDGTQEGSVGGGGVGGWGPAVIAVRGPGHARPFPLTQSLPVQLSPQPTPQLPSGSLSGSRNHSPMMPHLQPPICFYQQASMMRKREGMRKQAPSPHPPPPTHHQRGQPPPSPPSPRTWRVRGEGVREAP
jgi:hypothetical protein